MNVNIEAERVRCQLTKEELSAYLGIVPKTYSNYIKNKTPIPSNVLIQLADLFIVRWTICLDVHKIGR